MQEAIIFQGINLTLYGMSTVFVFLAVLVIATATMSTILNRYFPEPQAPIARKPIAHKPIAREPVVKVPATVNDPKVLAVIKAAVEQHRASQK